MKYEASSLAYILNFRQSYIYRKNRQYFPMLWKEKNQNALSSNESNYSFDISNVIPKAFHDMFESNIHI